MLAVESLVFQRVPSRIKIEHQTAEKQAGDASP